MATSFNKFTFMQAGALFPPARPFGHRLDTVYQMFLHPGGVTLPVDHLLAMLQMHRAR
ncbi:hypothetical protein D3C77_818870 [compost metagenome]